MPRFFFHIITESWDFGDPGEEFADAEVAMVEARQIARDLLADASGGWELMTMEVRDENRAVVGVVRISELSVRRR